MRLTAVGTGVVVGSVAALLAGLVLGVVAVVAIGAGGLVAVGVGALVVVEPPRMEVRRSASPSEVERGGSAEVTLDFRSGPRRGVRGVTVIETVGGDRRTAAVPALAPGHSVPIRYGLDTGKRGNIVAGPLLLRRTDPLGLVTAERRVGGTCAVAVRPRRHRLTLLPTGRLRDLEGPTRETSKGAASFHQLREYVPGDDMRHIHWRSTARTGDLMVKQLVDTSRPEVVVIVDNRRRAVGPDDFEEIVDVAASVMQAAEGDGFPTSCLFADGANEPGSDGHPPPFLDRLTSVRLSDDDSLAELSEALRARGRSLVFVTGELDAEDIATVGRIARGFSPAFVVSVVAERSAPFIAPPGVKSFSCATAAEFAADWGAFR